MMSDPISEMLARIRNANLRQHPSLLVTYSKMKEGILKLLVEEGFLEKVETEGEGVEKKLKVFLKYSHRGVPLIRSIKRISKPGLRVRKGYKELKPVLNSQGTLVVSTSSGIFSDAECRQRKVGGEILLEIY